jgi:hypothetical protein
MITEGISETVSENSTVIRRRGRPRRFTDQTIAWLQDIHKPEKRTTRHLQNFSYQARAQELIEPLVKSSPELGWLYDHEAIWRGEGTYRQTIMQALGRIDDDAVLIAVARRVCELKLRTRDAVALMRRVRKVQKPIDLTEALRRTLNIYLREHPELTLAQAREAVADLWGLIGRQMDAANYPSIR